MSRTYNISKIMCLYLILIFSESCLDGYWNTLTQKPSSKQPGKNGTVFMSKLRNWLLIYRLPDSSMIIWYFRLLKTCLSPEKCQAAWLETLTKDDHVYNQLVFIFKSSTSGKLTLICSFTLNDLIVHDIGSILRIWGIMLAVQFCILLCYSFMHLKISR